MTTVRNYFYSTVWLLGADGRRYLFAPVSGWESRWQTYWCRLRSHPDGIVFYNPGGDEPDYRCQRCGDDLG